MSLSSLNAATFKILSIAVSYSREVISIFMRGVKRPTLLAES